MQLRWLRRVASFAMANSACGAAVGGRDGEPTGPQSRTSPAVADSGAEEESSAPSISGDTVAESSIAGPEDSEAAVADRRARKVAPSTPRKGAPDAPRESSKWNDQPEVGNFGLFLGNWGMRGTLQGDDAKRLRRSIADCQIVKNPGQIVVLAEATPEVAALLEHPPEETTQDRSHGKLGERVACQHFVHRGNEEKSALLIAVRKDVATGLDCLEYESFNDHNYTEKKKQREARSRMLTCKAYFKQNIGHIGKEVVVMGVHGHCRTMKVEWQAPFDAFWDRLVAKVRRFGVVFLAGDFNMALTEVIKQLRSRHLLADCCAWYPWRHATKTLNQQSLAFDSCGIFYIGGDVEVKLVWGLDSIDDLAAVAGEEEIELDVYDGSNHPGQHWGCYRAGKATATALANRCLKQILEDLLTPSTAVAELQQRPCREGTWYNPYLRIKQKRMDKAVWMVDEDVHNGAHFPLCAFTNNSSARSKERAQERAQMRRPQGQRHREENAAKGKAQGKGGKGKTQGKGGKGKTQGKGGKSKGTEGTSAVAEKSAVAENASTKGQHTFYPQWNEQHPGQHCWGVGVENRSGMKMNTDWWAVGDEIRSQSWQNTRECMRGSERWPVHWGTAVAGTTPTEPRDDWSGHDFFRDPADAQWPLPQSQSRKLNAHI